MKIKPFGRYDYEELRAAAMATDAKQIDVDSLGEWFSQYGTEYWNGEYYDADGARVYPVYEWDEETEQGTIARYVFK